MAQIFGYGSLINTKSRMFTGGSQTAMPVRVHGVYRAWNISSETMDMTALGILLNEGSANGILSPVDDSSLSQLDIREGERYERKEIDLDTIVSLDYKDVPREKTFAYFLKSDYAGSKKPIALSYVDVVLSGCLEYSFEFGQEFVRTTKAWSHPINDRRDPRYVRAQTGLDYASIDRLLLNI